jgi:hypothetical protein
MSIQQRETIYKLAGVVLMGSITFFLSQLYFSFKDLQHQTNNINTAIEVVKSEVQHISKEVDKINEDFYKPTLRK